MTLTAVAVVALVVHGFACTVRVAADKCVCMHVSTEAQPEGTSVSSTHDMRNSR
jgi:hypothetical protein